MIKTHLDKIVDLGFVVDISWNSDFAIEFYDIDLLVLRASYESNDDFDDFMEICIDMFYIWYNKNYKLINTYENFDNGMEKDNLRDEIEKSVLGHITKSVNRELLLNKLI